MSRQEHNMVLSRFAYLWYVWEFHRRRQTDVAHLANTSRHSAYAKNCMNDKKQHKLYVLI